MAIRVICPSCGRVGRGPERAIGRKVQCPACGHRHRVEPDEVIPDGGSEAAGVPLTPPPSRKPPTKPAAAPSDDEIYDLDEEVAPPPARPVRSTPIVPAKFEIPESPPTTPMPVVVGVAGALLIVCLLGWVGMKLIGGGGKAEEVVAKATEAPPGAPPAANPAPAPAAATPQPVAPPAVVAAVPPPMPESRVPVAPGQIGVVEIVEALNAPIATAPTAPVAPPPTAVAATSPPVEMPADDSPPEPAEESEAAANARAGAAAVASMDDGAGKTLTTADIVAESDASVALIQGSNSSGTGFLVGPGLLATNAHVIDDEFIPDLEIRFVAADEAHKGPLKAELLYEDRTRDLAFLAVKTDLKPLRVAKVYNFRKGEDITVIGSPGLGAGQVLENAISRGVMSTKIQIGERDFYQLGIAINPGNSGGPVFDSSGRVIGVVTLKASKQEATGFSIPIEGVHEGLAKLASQSTADASRCRSQHRARLAVQELGGGGALLCLVIDLRRTVAATNNESAREFLAKLEPMLAELDKDAFPTLIKQAPRIKNDRMVLLEIRTKIGNLGENFLRIRNAYATRAQVNDDILRPWKQAHKQLLLDLAATYKLELAEGMMEMFNDHPVGQPAMASIAPQNLGQFGSRLRRPPIGGGSGLSGRSRQPGTSLRDRMRQRGRR